jgi:hypothetical protein
MNDPRHPLDQIAERAAEAAPTVLLPKLAALNNLKALWSDHRRRVNDSHALQMKALGQTPTPAPQDEMGDTIVTGDIRIMQQPQQPAASNGLSTLGKIGVGAALLTGGAGAGIVANEVLKDQPPAAVAPVEPGVDIDTDTDTWLNSNFGIETK